jgi:hypothetical protein
MRHNASGNPAAAKAPTTVRSKPPVASTITSTVGSSTRRESRASIPLSS